MRDEELFAGTVTVCLLIIVVGIIGGCAITNYTDRVAIEHGYQQVQDHGGNTHWEKK